MSEAGDAATFLRTLTPRPGVYVPDTGGLSGLGATPLAGGGVLFGLYHPTASRVEVSGTFNDWQDPGHPLKRHVGYFGVPNLWLGMVPDASPGDEYKFIVHGGVPGSKQWAADPYARRLGPSFADNNCVVVDPTRFAGTDAGWRTPDKADLILYELSVYGFTQGDPGIVHREKFVDGFRFDATHTGYMHHGFLHRLARELTRFKPEVILIAENLPNEPDLNRSGFDGFAQWADPFHDKMKALLREGTYQDSNHYDADRLGDIFYFCRSLYAAHTNNVVNYTESHDETSIPYEVGTNPVLNHPAARDRKGRLGLFATMVALGQPMIYMGQEFNALRDRNIVEFEWPENGPESSGFYRWTRRLIRLRRRYPALRISGYDPAADGRFAWIVGPWMDERHGGGRLVLGWRLRPTPNAFDTMVVLLNFQGFPVTVDLELGLAGTWVKLADVDTANDIPPEGTNSAGDPTALRSADGRFVGFELPASSGFLYKWEA